MELCPVEPDDDVAEEAEVDEVQEECKRLNGRQLSALVTKMAKQVGL